MAPMAPAAPVAPVAPVAARPSDAEGRVAAAAAEEARLIRAHKRAGHSAKKSRVGCSVCTSPSSRLKRDRAAEARPRTAISLSRLSWCGCWVAGSRRPAMRPAPRW